MPNTSSPGPGTYNYYKDTESIKFSLGRSKRILNNVPNSAVPGPGAYSPEFPKTTTKSVFGRSQRIFFDGFKPTPGPGHYNLTALNQSPSFSLRSRPVEKIVEKAPGPGKYDPKAEFVLDHSPNVALGRSQKNFETELEKSNKFIPGPGTYKKPTTLAGPKWGFGSSERSVTNTKNIPGPGSYDV